MPSRNEVIRERLSDRFRSTYHDRTRSYALRESEIFALVELGKFRVISTDDLSRFAYDGVKDRLEQDLQNLKKKRLISQRGIEARSNSKFWVLSLTIVKSLTFERHPNNLVKTALHAGRRQVRLPKEGRSLLILKVPPKKPKNASLQIRVEEDVGQQLDQYAEFIDASPS